MLKSLKMRLQQGHKTVAFPSDEARLPQGFRGRPVINPSHRDDLQRAAEECPTGAIALDPPRIDLGACTFCGLCAEACQNGAIRFTPDHRLAAGRRDDLVLGENEMRLVEALDHRTRSLFGRSLKLRVVSAGGCSGCEAELAALNNVVFDLSRFGIQFVASPRHADGVVITGPVTHNMTGALRATYAAIPTPRLVIAVGACAISGGVLAGADAAHAGIPNDIPVDLYVPGCPPHPLTILDGLVRLLGKRSQPERV